MSMRVAVALPSLDPGAPHRVEIDAAVQALAATEVEVECFAEVTLLREGEPGPPCWHYLRMAERHRDQPFDAALYPLGRDYRPYEPSWILMHQFPGAVWVLDAVLHHIAVGGLVLRGRWDAYRAAMDHAFGADGAVLTEVLSSWWTTSGFYGRHDPVPAQLAGQGRLLAASQPIVDSWSGPDLAAVVPLPQVGPAEPTAASGELRRLTILTMNLVSPEPILRALREIRAQQPELAISVVAPELVHEHRLLPACARLGGLDEIDWFVGSDWVGMRDLIDDSDAVALLRVDLTTAEDALLHHAFATGAAVIGLDAPGFDCYPAHAVAKGSPGAELEAWLPATVAALSSDADLCRALRASGSAFWAGQPGAVEIASQLRDQLAACAADSPLRQLDLAGGARAELRSNLERMLVTGGAGTASAALAREAIGTALGPAWWPQSAVGRQG